MEFGHILGGILGSIAEGRSLSDRTSRELALYYEKDDLMSAFPVPRMELDQVEVDLKFALEDMEMMKAAVPKASELTKQSALRARALVSENLNALTKAVTLSRKADTVTRIGEIVEDTVAAAVIAPTGLALSTKKVNDVRLETFDLKNISYLIAATLVERKLVTLKEQMALEQLVEIIMNILESAKKEQEAETHRLQEGMIHGDSRISALFMHKDLVHIPSNLLSSIKLKVNVRNYEWTTVNEIDGQPVRKLIPE